MKKLGVDKKLVTLVGLFILSILGILLYTILTLQEHKLDALRIDLAGRQRFLSGRYLNEVMLFAQGVNTDYTGTQKVFSDTLEALIHGGPALVTIGSDQVVHLPPAPTDVVRAKLIEQQGLMQAFAEKADRYLKSKRDSTSASSDLKELLSLNSKLQENAIEAVRLMNRYSDSRIVSMIKGEIIIAMLVALSGVLLTIHLIRAHRALINEITERQRAEKELRESEKERLEALQQSDSLKSALLSSVSHEFRTPLTTIKASVSTLLNYDGRMMADMQGEFLNQINQEVDYLAHLVNNLLDMSRIEAGALVPHPEWHPIEDLLEGAIRLMGAALQRRPLEISFPDERPLVHVDGVQVQQVLVNLLDNAVKYSPDETVIRVDVSVKQQQCEVHVSNVGEGIPRDQLQRIFERFHRARGEHDRGIPGTGLGLAICKGIIEAHGGGIWAESTPGELTTIVFVLPITKPASSVTMEQFYSRKRD